MPSLQQDDASQQAHHPFSPVPSGSLPDARATRRVRTRWHVKKRLLVWAAFLPFILLGSILANWAQLIPQAYAAPASLGSASGSLTYQQFLQESAQMQAGKKPFQRPINDPHTIKPQQPTTPPKTLPSAEPATMQDQSYLLDDSFVLHRPTMGKIPHGTSFQIQGSSIPSGSTTFQIKGNDGRLEVDLPRGSLDFTDATIAGGKAPVGQLILQVHQISGHYIEADSILGTYQLQVVDSLGEIVQGIQVTKPLGRIGRTARYQ